MNERYEKGAAIRREVLGDEYVDAAARNTTDFNRPFQELINEFVWGTLWARPGIDRRTRAMINLGMLTAMGRTEEVKIYLRAGPNVGLTREDVREVLMQTAIYCGIPAALDSFRAAQEVFNEQDSASGVAQSGGMAMRSVPFTLESVTLGLALQSRPAVQGKSPPGVFLQVILA